VKRIALPHIPEGGYDLILFHKTIRDYMIQMNETNINLVYLISSLKHPFITIPITRVKRNKGLSQWSFDKKRKLWIDTIVGFSYAPVRWLFNFAIITLLINFGFLIIFWLKASFSNEVKWAITIILSNAQVLVFGLTLVAEYLWRTLEASRKRPPFVIDLLLSNQTEESPSNQ